MMVVFLKETVFLQVMGEENTLILFSLDAVLSVPELMANAFHRALGKAVSRERVLAVLAERNLDPVRSAQVLASESRGQLTEVVIGFDREIAYGAYNLVYEDMRGVVYEAGYAQRGLFYGLPQPMLERVAKATKLDFEYVAGFQSEQGIAGVIGHIVSKAAGDMRRKQKTVESVVFVLGPTIQLPQDIDEYAERVRLRTLRTSQYDVRAVSEELLNG